MNLWSISAEYPTLQAKQLKYLQFFSERSYLCVFHEETGKIIRLQTDVGSQVLENMTPEKCSYLLTRSKVPDGEGFLNPASRPDLQITATSDGSQVKIKRNYWDNYLAGISPAGHYVIWFDSESECYFGFDLQTHKNINITKNIVEKITDETDQRKTFVRPYGVGGWSKNDSSVFIYDRYDIWCCDPKGMRTPVCLTGGFGRKNKIIFRLPGNAFSGPTVGRKIVLAAFDEYTKDNGFYLMNSREKTAPRRLYMGPYSLYFPEISPSSGIHISDFLIKATTANIYLLRRSDASTIPNLFSTRDFEHFTRLSYLEPEKKYNWLEAVLLHYKLPNGQNGEGVLYKPENFDSTKKYPVIVNFYEKFADGVHEYLYPGYSLADINLPFFVSNGYLVLRPDIYVQPGHPAESVYNSVVSAVKHIMRYSWVDSTKIAFQGFSHGGIEAYDLLTRSHLFAAAASGGGYSDVISAYNSISPELLDNNQFWIEDEYHLDNTLWQRPDLYFENSPVLHADKVTTPLLILHNKLDNRVSFSQAIEFFLALRGQGKKVWLLQYDQENHGLANAPEKTQIDYSIRLTQFFDYYLKGAPPPVWMTRGIPASLKGTDSGLELDTSGAQP